jgi:hypothetical protein
VGFRDVSDVAKVWVEPTKRVVYEGSVRNQLASLLFYVHTCSHIHHVYVLQNLLSNKIPLSK